MVLWANMSLSQHPKVMSDTSSMCVRTHYTALSGPETSTAAALVFSFP